MLEVNPDSSVLRAAYVFGRDGAHGYCKCATVIRHCMELAGGIDDSAEVAICNSGYGDSRVADLYDRIRKLVKLGLLEGRGDLELPAGPRYTECRITSAGMQYIHAAQP